MKYVKDLPRRSGSLEPTRGQTVRRWVSKPSLTTRRALLVKNVSKESGRRGQGETSRASGSGRSL